MQLQQLPGWIRPGVMTGLLAVGLTLALGTSGRAEPLLGLAGSGQQLVRFDSASPNATTTVNVTGLNGAVLRGIDLRPSNSLLYGVATNNAIYTINANTGAATLISNLSSSLSGNDFGVDFNPIPDSTGAASFRVVSDLDQNLRIQVADGTTNVDGTLAYAAGDPNAGANPFITAVGYANNVFGATTTALFGIDTTLNVLVQQNPANAGTLNTLGSLGVNSSGNAGLDISGLSGIAFASLTVNGVNGLYTLNTSTSPGINNRAAFVGLIGNGTVPIISLTALSSAVPEPGSIALLGLGSVGGLASMYARRRRARLS